MRANRSAGITGACEAMEPRLLLCMSADIIDNPIFQQPQNITVKESKRPSSSPLVANIVWTNRGQASDRFSSVFGANAATARAVVDAVIVAWEQVIASFNYSDGSTTYNVTISMDSAGTSLGAAANVSTKLNGKPKSGVITMGRGLDTTGDGLGDGGNWFLDPTPNEHSEFMGTIENAFAGNAQAGSPAAGKNDFYTVVAAEMTHCMGLIHHTDTLFQSGGFNTDTGIADDAEANGVGNYFRFESATIDHLMTSNNGGPGGSDFGVAIHSAGDADHNISSGGQQWRGADDVGNAVYEGSRRYLVNDVFAMTFGAAYSYSTNLAQQFANFYAVLNTTTHELLIRGSTNFVENSPDVITIFGVGATISVSVDVGLDVPGTGAGSEFGNLPAFVTSFNSADVTSVRIETGSGNDIINLNSINFGIPVDIDMGDDFDILNIGNGDLDSNIKGAVTVDFGNGGAESLNLKDATDNDGADSYTITSSTVAKSGFETFPTLTYSRATNLRLEANGFDNVINDNSQPPGGTFTFEGNGGSDTFNIGNGLLGNTGTTVIAGGAGTNTVVFNDSSNNTPDSYTLTAGTLTHNNFTKAFSAIQGITLSCSTVGNTINLNALLTGMPLVVNGNGGGDTFNVGNGDCDTNVISNVTLNGNSGTDSVIFNDTTDGVGSDSYTLSNVQFNKSIGGDVTYLTIESIRVDASPNNDSISVQSVASNAPMTINCGNGNDTVTVGNGDFDAGMLTGMILRGDAGTDALIMDDTIDTGTGSYNIDTGFVGKSTTFTGVSYQTIESVTVNGSAQASTFDIDGTTSGVPVTVNGNDGADLFNVNAPVASAITLNGGNPTSGAGDHVQIFGTATSSATYTPSATTVGNGIVNFDGQVITFTGLENSNDDVSIDTMQTFTLLTPASADVIDIGSLAINGQNLFSGTSGGVAIAEARIKNVANIVVNTGANDGASPNDVVTINPLGLLETGFQTFRFIGGTSASNADTLNVQHGTLAFNTDASLDTRNLTLNVNTDNASTASVTFNATQHLAALNLGTGGSASMPANGNRFLMTGALTIPANTKLDLFDNDLIVDYSGASQLASIVSLISSARNGGTWTGTTGIGSTTAAAANPKNKTLGAMEATDFKSVYGAAATFDGQTIDNTAVLVKFTWYGDADFNGKVDGGDYARIDARFNQQAGSGNIGGWLNGDFDYNNKIDGSDYGLIDAAFNSQIGVL